MSTDTQKSEGTTAVWLVQIIALVVLGFLFRVIYDVAVPFEEEFYTGSFLLPVALSNQKFLSGFLIMLLPMLVFYRRLSWQATPEEALLKKLVFAVALLIAWQLATLDYNYYYRTWHALDRALLLLFALGVWMHPVFLPLLVLQGVLFSQQVEFPLGAFDWTDKQVFFDLLIYTQVGVLLRLACSVRSMTVFFMLTLVFNTHYFFAGVQKLQLSPHGYEWITENQVSNLVLASYHNGWLRGLGQETFDILLSAVSAVPQLLTLPTIIIEVGSLLVFLGPFCFHAIMWLHVLLHVLIVLSSGVFFWKWCILNIVFILLAPRNFTSAMRELFSRRNFYTALPLFALSPLLFQPVPLGWFDTTYVHIIRPYSVDADGVEREIEGFFFGPYNMLFQQSRFYYLSTKPSLVNTYGGTENFYLARKLEESLSDEELHSLRERVGKRVFDAEKKSQFEHFMRKYVSAYNAKEVDGIPSLLAAPYHIYSFAVDEAFRGHGPITLIRVRSLTYYRDKLFENEILVDIAIPREEVTPGD